MHLSWNEIRARAARFSDVWAGATYEKGEMQSFYNDFFDVFGVQRRKVASFEEPVKKLGNKQGFIDLFWKGMLLVEHKSAGRSLIKAKSQALEYFPGLKDWELPRYVQVSDFQNFELLDLDEGTEIRFTLPELHRNIEHYGFILGVQKRTFRDQDPVNIEASALMGRLHDALKASGYGGDDLERLLVRLVFCLFADDTGIFGRDAFLDLITNRTTLDGADTGLWLSKLSDVLNTPYNERQKTLDEDLAKFPYINGDLFKERLPIPDFDSAMRGLLLEACNFSWDAISPAIFGSLFQSVMNAKERRAVGAHYTTEKNIMKVIQPLFLDDLRAELSAATARRGPAKVQALRALHDKLASLTFFDPACGCGNFLIITYRELRMLEIEILKELYPRMSGEFSRQAVLDVSGLSKIDVNQFYGIEIGEFPARIAEVALWMMDHIMNNRLSLEFGEAFARIPLKKSPHIHHADALELDWTLVLPPEQCSYILGNPPFIGQSFQTPEQRKQMARIVGNLRGGSLDYVTAWFLKAGAYVNAASAVIAAHGVPQGDGSAVHSSVMAGLDPAIHVDARVKPAHDGPKTRIGFVSTNSITQGEQVAQLWPLLFDRFKLEIAFAHRTFAWGSDARGKAHVHVVIIGLCHRNDEPKEKRLFSYDDINGEPVESRHSALSPYLFDAGGLGYRHLVVADLSAPHCDAPKMYNGPKSTDNGYYIFRGVERHEFLKLEPAAEKFMQPYVGAEEFINGKDRFILFLGNASPAELRAMPHVLERIQRVRQFREKSQKPATRKLADMPTELEGKSIPENPFLVIPQVSSERRNYIPFGWMEPPAIPSDKLRWIENADLWHFGILTSQMHMAWVRTVTGRMKSDYMYSVGICYNPFPWPEADEKARGKIRIFAQAVLDARAAHPGATLADLYDPDVMPPDLRKAHKALDAAVDRLYRAAPFQSDRERVEHLFGLYEKIVAPLTAIAGARRKKSRS